ncbi:adenosine deaminase [Pseudonocardia xinjiangensis]|uniref:Adenosine deaminase n=2 Tax=Pseudonocardia xinjiangensis TaxID=75289 RepID=A0ABX1RDW5_9PSEU|nr:adenosine deaminase [Pseudonocardia xinjiangensis]
MARDLARLPKAHLHLHLEGAMRPSTLADLAAAAGVPVPPVRGYTSFAEFGLQYRAASALITTEDHLRRVVREVVDDAADDGALWVEPHFYPLRYTGQLGTSEDVLEIVLDEGQRAAAARGIGCGWIVSALRDFDPAQAVELAKLAARYAGAGVVSFGLAADEALFGPEPFAEAFGIARDAGLISAPHAGELAGPASVYGALDALGARRICHGVRAVEDPALVERLATDGIVLDVCPTSNVMLAVVPSFDEHPLLRLLDAGVRCTLNGDDPLLFGPGLLAEYELARDTMGLSDERLAQLAHSSLVGSGAPAELVSDGVERVEEWLTTPV